MWLRTHQTLVTALIVAVCSVVLVFVAVVPIYQNASTLQKKVKTKSDELTELINKVSILSKLDPSVLDERMKIIDSALPPRKDVLLYLNSIDGLSRELGLTLGGITLTPGDITVATQSASTKTKKTTALALQSLDTEIKINGGLQSLYAFLRTIEEVLPLMQIKDIKVSILGGEQYGLNLTLGMLWADPSSIDIKGKLSLFGTEEEKYFNQLSGYRQFNQLALPSNVQQGKKDLFAPPSVIPLQ